jgi:hypothetical protein
MSGEGESKYDDGMDNLDEDVGSSRTLVESKSKDQPPYKVSERSEMTEEEKRVVR